MKEYEHKEEIINTRIGCLGASDGRLLAQIDTLGSVPQSAYKRLAIVKGLIPNEETPANYLMKAGDYAEYRIYNDIMLKRDARFQSNPRWESKKFSRKFCKLIAHPDFVLEDTENKILHVYECKATKYSIAETRNNYKAQLFIQYELAKEIARSLGLKWRIKMYLAHYGMNDVDVQDDGEFDFDERRVTFEEVRFINKPFNIDNAMGIVDNFLSTFDFYSESDSVESNLLPEKVQNQFKQVAMVLQEIKRKEKLVEDFKAKLYEFLSSKGIKGVQGDDFSFTVVQPTTQVSFDGKKFLEDYTQEHPTKAKRLKAKYSKTINKKGYVKVSVKLPDDSQQSTNNNNN